MAPLPVPMLRAVRLLEQLGTAEGRAVLAQLADQGEEPALVAEARATLNRVSRRK